MVDEPKFPWSEADAHAVTTHDTGTLLTVKGDKDIIVGFFEEDIDGHGIGDEDGALSKGMGADGG